MLENLAPLDPDKMTQYETFVRLTKTGKTVEDIAATFGITELMVKRRLALGELLPKIREAYRNEDLLLPNRPPNARRGRHGRAHPEPRRWIPVTAKISAVNQRTGTY